MQLGAFLKIATLLMLVCTPCRTGAESFTFTKIADFNTAIPGGKKTFTALHNPSINDTDLVVFRGRGSSGQRGVYAYRGGHITVVANGNTALPGAAGFLTGVSDVVTNSLSDVVFQGKAYDHHGIYSATAGSLAVVVNSDSPIPDGTGNFISFSNPLISDQGNVVFRGEGYNSQRGIYTITPAGLVRLVDTNTIIPKGKRFFTNVRHLSINREGTVVFNGKGHFEQQGIYTIKTDGSIIPVADRSTPIPGGSKTFKKFRKSAIDADGQVVFKAKGRLEQRGIYAYKAGILSVVADCNTAIPDGTGNFSLFGVPSIDSGYVAFTGSGEYEGGLYTTLGGALKKVLSWGEMIDGKTVTDIIFQPDGLKGNVIAFKVIFQDSSRGLYIASWKGD